MKGSKCMANFSKATKGASDSLLDHYERRKEIKFKNQDIDKSKSHLNYNLAPNKNLSQREILNQRLSEVKVLKRNDINIICSWVITLPKTIKKEYAFLFYSITIQRLIYYKVQGYLIKGC